MGSSKFLYCSTKLILIIPGADFKPKNELLPPAPPNPHLSVIWILCNNWSLLPSQTGAVSFGEKGFVVKAHDIQRYPRCVAWIPPEKFSWFSIGIFNGIRPKADIRIAHHRFPSLFTPISYHNFALDWSSGSDHAAFAYPCFCLPVDWRYMLWSVVRWSLRCDDGFSYLIIVVFKCKY